MKYEYGTSPINMEYLTPMWKDWRFLNAIHDWKMIWSKPVKKTVTKKEPRKDEKWLEFRTLYNTIKDSWLSNSTLIVKYNTLCDEWLHDMIIENLKQYKIYLETKKKQQYALMAQTYLNQERFRDKWEIIEDQSRKFINDIFKELELTADEISNVKTEIQAYEIKHKKEVSDWTVRSLIHYIRTGSPL